MADIVQTFISFYAFSNCLFGMITIITQVVVHTTTKSTTRAMSGSENDLFEFKKRNWRNEKRGHSNDIFENFNWKV